MLEGAVSCSNAPQRQSAGGNDKSQIPASTRLCKIVRGSWICGYDPLRPEGLSPKMEHREWPTAMGDELKLSTGNTPAIH